MSEFNVRTFHTPMRRIEFRQTFPAKRMQPDPTNPVTTYNEAGRLARRLGFPRPGDPPPAKP
jgi:hypothetical protein